MACARESGEHGAKWAPWARNTDEQGKQHHDSADTIKEKDICGMTARWKKA